MVMKLRRLCNHGTMALPDTDRPVEMELSDNIAVLPHAHVEVLLISIQTGSVGLNLTAAEHVHVIEPQWNHSVEDQAAARALRMGQTKTVRVFRYVMKDTVEENILTRQKRKRKTAKFTMDGGSWDGISGSLDVSMIAENALTASKLKEN
ncbi:P-loop containing nucleoside triphosphate hydrolase protein [Podospora didyma]|uniref:P-loop containing nucleoside triphosphate hydrolase protein n=1 Tax=Podospora didyma TaxID=330526 RepID=A0AAE0NQF5_9PEZI|nr:P-loop containing nucleoside triphosphate hydrolase protein [Podospora didyma]